MGKDIKMMGATLIGFMSNVPLGVLYTLVLPIRPPLFKAVHPALQVCGTRLPGLCIYQFLTLMDGVLGMLIIHVSGR
ncbi:hypothetical protein CXU19_00305 [Akkermansia muciniphila]|nr:hypothetical protein CXU19_00305 [Akkermansia muciniphila]PNC37558.1 hypothetical protein CXU20_12250 [Akkermansia muciniphila]